VNSLNDWHQISAAPLNEVVRQAALGRQQVLTKPPGSLGRLEELAVRLASMQGIEQPAANDIHISIFVADHGVAAEGISAFPQAVTAEMVRNFARGGAAINVLANALDATLEIVNLGTVAELEPLPNVSNARIGPGTANFTQQAAMDEEQLLSALLAGQHVVQCPQRSSELPNSELLNNELPNSEQRNNVELFIAGEMGIGNTTSASAVACALLQLPATQLVGPGTGLDSSGVAHKTKVTQKALDLHQRNIHSPLDALRYLGGYEIAALTGCYLSCAKAGIPVLIDGFITSVAALCASKLCPKALDWFIFSHQSAEPGHQYLLNVMEVTPLLTLSMRLGEASGAATAVPLIRLACQLHNHMATFEEARVSAKKA